MVERRTADVFVAALILISSDLDGREALLANRLHRRATLRLTPHVRSFAPAVRARVLLPRVPRMVSLIITRFTSVFINARAIQQHLHKYRL